MSHLTKGFVHIMKIVTTAPLVVYFIERLFNCASFYTKYNYGSVKVDCCISYTKTLLEGCAQKNKIIYLT